MPTESTTVPETRSAGESETSTLRPGRSGAVRNNAWPGAQAEMRKNLPGSRLRKRKLPSDSAARELASNSSIPIAKAPKPPTSTIETRACCANAPCSRLANRIRPAITSSSTFSPTSTLRASARKADNSPAPTPLSEAISETVSCRPSSSLASPEDKRATIKAPSKARSGHRKRRLIISDRPAGIQGPRAEDARHLLPISRRH